MSLLVTSTADEAADRVANLLAELGDTPGGIADRLFYSRITGIPNDACRCAVAVYLSRAEPALTGFEVNGAVVTFEAEDGSECGIATPAAVAEFIEGFDTGLYSHLYSRGVSPHRGSW